MFICKLFINCPFFFNFRLFSSIRLFFAFGIDKVPVKINLQLFFSYVVRCRKRIEMYRNSVVFEELFREIEKLFYLTKRVKRIDKSCIIPEMKKETSKILLFNLRSYCRRKVSYSSEEPEEIRRQRLHRAHRQPGEPGNKPIPASSNVSHRVMGLKRKERRRT